MKRNIIGVLVVLLTLTAIAVAGTLTGAAAEDKNTAIIVRGDDDVNSMEMPEFPRSPGAVAYAWIQGPPNSYNIKVNVMNALPGKQIRFVELNPLIAKTGGNERLIIDDYGVFSLVAPPGGTIDALYPTGTALPGAMVEFTGFDNGEVAAFNLDPDTFGSASYGATVSEMQSSLIKVWFSDGTTAGINVLSDYQGHQLAIIYAA
jgi:hypothetical protein